MAQMPNRMSKFFGPHAALAFLRALSSERSESLSRTRSKRFVVGRDLKETKVVLQTRLSEDVVH